VSWLQPASASKSDHVTEFHELIIGQIMNIRRPPVFREFSTELRELGRGPIGVLSGKRAYPILLFHKMTEAIKLFFPVKI